MANHRCSMIQYNAITPQSEKVPSVPTSSTAEALVSNCASPQQPRPRATVKKRFFFSTSNIRFWTTGLSEKKTSRQKLSNSAADIVNHGDQLRYIKEERNTMRRRLYECSLRNSEHNLQLMQTSCTNDQQQRQRQQGTRGDTIQLRQMSEPNVNIVNDRNAQERYLQFLSRTNDRSVHQFNDYNDQSDKIEQDNSCSSEWEEWMKNQPISVLRLDRTERLVLKIGAVKSYPEFFI